MKGFDIELSVVLSETKKTISKAFNNVYEQGFAAGYSKALHDVWVKAIGKVDEILSLEELNEVLEELKSVDVIEHERKTRNEH